MQILKRDPNNFSDSKLNNILNHAYEEHYMTNNEILNIYKNHFGSVKQLIFSWYTLGRTWAML